jgi:hypothetical protein
MKDLMKLLTISVLVAVVVGTCGCTNPVQTVQNAVTPTNKALDYANAMLALKNETLKPNETMVQSKAIANGSDGARVTYIIEDTTKNGLWANGTSLAISGTVKEYASKDEAIKAFDDASFGYKLGNASDIADMTKPANDTYLKAFGHKATINNQATNIDNLSLFSVSATVVGQQDEIVTVLKYSVRPK